MPLPKVLITSSHSARSMAVLAKYAEVIDRSSCELNTYDHLHTALMGCDALVCPLTTLITRDLIDSCPDLKLIANVAVGYDNIDVDAANKYGVLVTNTPGVLDRTTAELAFGLLLACARRIAEADRYVRGGLWRRWEPDLMLGIDVHNKTLGIVGLGRIGKQLAKLAKGFDLKILYCRSRMESQSSLDEELGVESKQVSLHELLQEADFVSVHCPLNKDTYHLIGPQELSLVKPSCILINTSRGAVVDQMALTEALRDGRLAGAGLDVFEDEPNVPMDLKEMHQVILTPHIGSASVETREAMSMLAIKGLTLAFTGTMPSNVVNSQTWNSFKSRAARFFIDPQLENSL